jgi:hypothetical protein
MGNTTISLPEGASNHGDPRLLCLPTGWADVVVFFLGNYFAHAATVVSLPGESPVATALSVVLALLCPVTGLGRGLLALKSLAKFAETDLQQAARAGALCHVVRERSNISGKKGSSSLQHFLNWLSKRCKPTFIRLHTIPSAESPI